MAVTDAPPEAPTRPAAVPVPAPIEPPTGGFAGVLGSGDHKVIGRLYLGFSLLYLL